MSPKPPSGPPRGGRAPGPPAAGGQDPALARYLEALDLDSVDLERLDLDALSANLPPVDPVEANEGGWRLLAGGGLCLLALPLQASDTYQLHGQPWWLAAWLVGGLAVVGVDGLAALVALLRRLRSLTASPTPAGTPGAPGLRGAGWRRWALLGAGVGLLLLLVVAAPQGGWGPQHGSMGWLLSVVVAIAAGLVLSRWLIEQGEHDRAKAASLPPRVGWTAPGWLKWASLAILVAGALAAWSGVGVPEGPQAQFARTGLGFAVGLGAAIWLANRVDEGERARRQRGNRGPARLTGAQKDDI